MVKFKFYTFRVSTLIHYAVNLQFTEKRLKAISRHTEFSKVLERVYLAKGKLMQKIDAALHISHSATTMSSWESTSIADSPIFELDVTYMTLLRRVVRVANFSIIPALAWPAPFSSSG